MLRPLLCTVLGMSLAVSASAADPVLLVITQPGHEKLAPGLSAAVQKASGKKPENVSALYESLSMGLSINFDRDPPAGWPSALAADFKAGHAACQARVGTPTPGPEGQRAIMTAMSCGEKLRKALWARYLLNRKSGTVITVSTSPFKTGYQGTVHTLRLADKRQWTATTEAATEDEAVKWLSKGIADTYAKRGTEAPAALNTDLPKASTRGQIAAVTRAETELAAVDVGCSSELPASVVIDTASPLAETIAARWKRSVEASKIKTGPPLKCTLSASQDAEESIVGPMEVVEVILKCGMEQSRGSTALGPALRGKTAADAVSERLLKAAFKAHCAK